MSAERAGHDAEGLTTDSTEEASTSDAPHGLEAIAEASIPRAAAAPLQTSSADPKHREQPDVVAGAWALGWLLGEGDHYEVRIGATIAKVVLDPSFHPAVARTARERREAVLVTRAPGGELVVVGALRTSPTPGVDEMDEISLKAKRIRIEATQDAEIRAGVAVIALRAVGDIETYAERIVSRAEELQKLVARMLRLN